MLTKGNRVKFDIHNNTRQPVTVLSLIRHHRQSYKYSLVRIVRLADCHDGPASEEIEHYSLE